MSLRTFAVLAYSLLVTLAWPLVRLLANFSKALAWQLEGREKPVETAKRIAPLRAAKDRGVLFLVSSAGEYEQAKPLIERFLADGRTFCHVVFFSRSGWEYAKKRAEKVSMSLGPADTVWNWGTLMGAVRPDASIVVRHELWPAFLEAATSYGKAYLIDGSVPETSLRPGPARLVKKALLTYFERVFAVDDKDAALFHEHYDVPQSEILVTGDTKYDRVRERAEKLRAESAVYRDRLRALSPKPHRLVLGSAWEADLQCYLEARNLAGSFSRDWLTLVAPHDISGTMLSWMETEIRKQGLSVVRWTEIAHSRHPERSSRHPERSEGPHIVLIDAMGQLAELYAAADAAFVGGALHHKVHNVLEPACYGLALAFGPYYKNSREAVRMVDAGWARVVSEARSFADWWRDETPPSEKARQGILAAVDACCGAAGEIHALIDQQVPLPTTATDPGL